MSSAQQGPRSAPGCVPGEWFHSVFVSSIGTAVSFADLASIALQSLLYGWIPSGAGSCRQGLL